MKLWEPFTDAVLAALKSKQHLVWMLWGNFAKKFIPLIPSNHLVLETVHPASTVYSGANEFNPRFTEVNKYLIEHAKKPIDWYPTEDDLPF
ncbi:MAG TPA: hypothetical protein PKD00_09570 [Burkholderiales bacterium]|nr:hypothetical protein [Burkholderiales bacterium]